MNQGLSLRLLSRVAALASLALLGWTIYYAVLNLAPTWVDSGPAVQPPPDNIPGRDGSRIAQDYDIEAIVAAHLFGEAARETEAPQTVAAPETKLRLSLVGLIASADSYWARAWIEVNQAQAESYRVGQRIEGTDATLKSVEDTRVLLERGSAVESLVMDLQRLGLASDTRAQNGNAN